METEENLIRDSKNGMKRNLEEGIVQYIRECRQYGNAFKSIRNLRPGYLYSESDHTDDEELGESS